MTRRFATILAVGLFVSQPPHVSLDAAHDTMLGIDGRANGYVSLAADGDFVVAVWAASLDGVTDVYAATSIDGARTFRPPVRVNAFGQPAAAGSERPPRVVIHGAAGGHVITMAWTASRPDRTGTDIRLARSTDGGHVFQPAGTLHAQSAPGLRSWASLTAGPDGAIHAAWLDGRDSAKTSEVAPKRRQSPASGVHRHGGKGPTPRQDLFYARLAGDGLTHERRIATAVCFCCKTAIGADPGGDVVVAWRHIFPVNERDIAVSRVTGDSNTLNGIARVSEDRWQIDACPDDGPAMTVDAHRTVHVIWPTVANGEKAIFYSRSSAAGSFLPRVRVDAPLGAGGSSPGHPQLAIQQRGSLGLAWDESRGQQREIVVRHMTAQNPGQAAGTRPAPEALRQPGANPAIAALADGFVVAWSTPSVDGHSRIRVSRLPNR